MEVKEYTPIYRKAMIDLLKKYDKNQVPILEECLNRDDLIAFVLIEKKKFKGYVVGNIVNANTVFCLLWQSKTPQHGMFLAHEAIKKVKQLGYKELIFSRDQDQKLYRREL